MSNGHILSDAVWDGVILGMELPLKNKISRVANTAAYAALSDPTYNAVDAALDTVIRESVEK